MKRCPITYEKITPAERYSKRGLHLLSPQLTDLLPLNLSAAEQRMEALARAGKMSVQGVQTKLSAQLRVKKQCFEIVGEKGHFILKTQSEHYPELPENEAITMVLASLAGLEVPLHGLIYAKDQSMTYFIRRFDRIGHQKKLCVEDFAQLSGRDRTTKYDSSMEKVAEIIMKFTTFPKIELVKLFRLTVFNFLTGNEDMHLKNFSLITRNKKIMLSPVYDLLNTSIALKNFREETALPLNGKKNSLNRRDFLNYFAGERLGLNQTVVQDVMDRFRDVLPLWTALIGESFLSPGMRDSYLQLLRERSKRLGLCVISAG